MLRASRVEGVVRLDVARTIAGRGRYWTTAYFVDGLMVDTGCAHTAAELVRAMRGERIARIVNTHSHEDHIGANAALSREHGGLEILAHRLAVPILADPHAQQPLQPYRRIFWGWPEPSMARPVDDGDRIRTEHYTFHVLHTPGHSPDHLCLYEEQQGWLFSGDLFVGGQDRALREGYNVWEIISSLKRVAELPLKTLFPGSARVRRSPREELIAKIEHLERTGDRVLRLHREGRAIPAIGRELFGGPGPVELVTLGHFSRRHFVLSYLIHPSPAKSA
jgi:glyoxylase-like metal-dependent hydrolase (beta-lactamase superfamily II)